MLNIDSQESIVYLLFLLFLGNKDYSLVSINRSTTLCFSNLGLGIRWKLLQSV